MDPYISQRFARYVGPGESIRWTGRPQQGVAFRTVDLFLVPFSVLWCGFAIFWASASFAWNAPSPFTLFGALFVAAGLYFVFGRFIVDAIARARTYYALTDERALILGGFWGNELTSVTLSANSEVRFRDANNGRGTITFGRDEPWRRWGAWHSSSGGAPEFYRTDNADEALRIIQNKNRR